MVGRESNIQFYYEKMEGREEIITTEEWEIWQLWTPQTENRPMIEDRRQAPLTKYLEKGNHPI